jgi:hypothetical protein
MAAAAAGMGDPSLQAAGVLGPACQVPGSKSYRSCCSYKRTKPAGSESCGACLLAQASRSTVQQLLLAWGTKPACLLLLLSVEQWEPWVLLIQGSWLSWCFRVKVAGYVVEGSMES